MAAAATLDDTHVGRSVGCAQTALPLPHRPEWLKVKRSEIALYDTAVSEWERKAYLGV